MGAPKWMRHFALVCRHRHAVLRHCAKCGLLWRGLVHDLSKFSPTEFWESAKYFTGVRSPIVNCRMETGVSRAWLHHKGRNRHHMEYWQDDDLAEHPLMPYPFAVECICDKIAATKVYLGKEKYTDAAPLAHWDRYGHKVRANEKTKAFARHVFEDLAEHGEKYVLNPAYMKKTYADICGKNEGTESEATGGDDGQHGHMPCGH